MTKGKSLIQNHSWVGIFVLPSWRYQSSIENNGYTESTTQRMKVSSANWRRKATFFSSGDVRLATPSGYLVEGEGREHWIKHAGSSDWAVFVLSLLTNQMVVITLPWTNRKFSVSFDRFMWEVTAWIQIQTKKGGATIEPRKIFGYRIFEEIFGDQPFFSTPVVSHDARCRWDICKARHDIEHPPVKPAFRPLLSYPIPWIGG